MGVSNSVSLKATMGNENHIKAHTCFNHVKGYWPSTGPHNSLLALITFTQKINKRSMITCIIQPRRLLWNWLLIEMKLGLTAPSLWDWARRTIVAVLAFQCSDFLKPLFPVCDSISRLTSRPEKAVPPIKCLLYNTICYSSTICISFWLSHFWLYYFQLNVD